MLNITFCPSPSVALEVLRVEVGGASFVADDLIYTDENWRVLTKAEILTDFRPLPKGYSGSIKVAEVRSRVNEDAAVVSWQAHEEETVYGQKLSPVYLVTDKYFRRGGRRQLVADDRSKDSAGHAGSRRGRARLGSPLRAVIATAPPRPA